MTGNEKFRLKVIDDLRKNRVIVKSDDDYILLLKNANKDLGDLVRLRDEQIAKLTAERDELLKAIALAMPVMDAHAGPSRLADFHAAIASVNEKS